MAGSGNSPQILSFNFALISYFKCRIYAAVCQFLSQVQTLFLDILPYPYHAQFSETFIPDFQLDSQNQYRNLLNYNLTIAKIRVSSSASLNGKLTYSHNVIGDLSVENHFVI